MPTINLISLGISAVLYGAGHLIGFLHGKFAAAKAAAKAATTNVAQKIAR